MRNAILVSALVLATPLAGDQLRIATSNDWRQWQLPGDAVEVARGTLKPSFVRRNINAVANAFDFASGGIRKVGSNPGDALKLIDGDPSDLLGSRSERQRRGLVDRSRSGARRIGAQN